MTDLDTSTVTIDDADIERFSQARAAVAELDLTNLARDLERHWMQGIEVVDAYRDFLALRVAFPDRTVLPSPAVDEAWHLHILDTHAYHHDCEQLFGKYLHHVPRQSGSKASSFRETNALLDALGLDGLARAADCRDDDPQCR